MENSLSPCPGPTREPQLLLLALEMKIKGLDAEIQHHIGGLFQANPVVALDRTHRKVTEQSKQEGPPLIQVCSVTLFLTTSLP